MDKNGLLDTKALNGRKSEDNDKFRSLSRTMQSQLKQARKKDFMGKPADRNTLVYFVRENLMLLLLLLISVLCVYTFWFTYSYWKLIRHKNILEPNSRALRLFKSVPMENMKVCISIFNYTNIEEFNLNNSVPFDVESVGPFCFRDIPNKKDVSFNTDETEISFQEDSSVRFLPNESKGTLDDLVVVPNIPLLGVFHQVLERSYVIRLAMATKIKLYSYEPFLQLKVSDFLFGYYDELLEWIYKMGKTVGYESPMRRFSLLDSVMKSMNSRYTLDTGLADVNRLGDMIVYNDQTRLSVWKTDECNEFRGSYGAYWPPASVREGGNVSFFNGFLCRNVPLVKEQDTRYANFISVARYQSSPDLFTYPSNASESCYCLEEPCIDNLFSVGKCLSGPFVLSYRNFYGVDRDKLPHINFDKLTTYTSRDDEWKTYFDIHPGLGNTMSFKTTFQLNVQVKKKNLILDFPVRLEHDQILPTVVIERSGPNLNKKTTTLLIVLSVVEGTLQYGSILLTLVLVYVLVRRLQELRRLFYVHKVTVSPPIYLYHQSTISHVTDQRKIYSQL
ncbi:hypothetical protein M8J77_024625 [Diaphorina citri]|nr:hypothetical protein M8J77_024625 [Diaphorina citri]